MVPRADGHGNGRRARTQPAEGAEFGGRRSTAFATRPQLFALFIRVLDEALVHALEKAEQEGRLAPWRLLLDRVQRLLVPKVPVASRHRALFDDVVDAGQQAI